MAARALFSSRLAGHYGQEAVNCGRRAFSAAAAAVARKEPVEVAGKARSAAKMEEEESFWMRDPKTGCWMPENHLHDVDAADLRARLLFSKKD